MTAHRCKLCEQIGHNAATCPEADQPIGLVIKVGADKADNYYKVSRPGVGGASSVLVTFNSREPGVALEAMRRARQKLSVPGWEGASLSVFRVVPGVPFDVPQVGDLPVEIEPREPIAIGVPS